MGDGEYAPLSRLISCIVASGIPHHLLAATLPCLPGSNALNSFVLPIQEVERQSCSYAGSLPLWWNSTWLSRLPFYRDFLVL